MYDEKDDRQGKQKGTPDASRTCNKLMEILAYEIQTPIHDVSMHTAFVVDTMLFCRKWIQFQGKQYCHFYPCLYLQWANSSKLICSPGENTSV